MSVGRIIGFRQASEGKIDHIDQEQQAERWIFRPHVWQWKAINRTLPSDWTAQCLEHSFTLWPPLLSKSTFSLILTIKSPAPCPTSRAGFCLLLQPHPSFLLYVTMWYPTLFFELGFLKFVSKFNAYCFQNWGSVLVFVIPFSCLGLKSDLWASVRSPGSSSKTVTFQCHLMLILSHQALATGWGLPLLQVGIHVLIIYQVSLAVFSCSHQMLDSV